MEESLKKCSSEQVLAAGIDIGSTTTKVVILDPEDGSLLYSDYRRHHADQVKSVINVMDQLRKTYPGQKFRFALTGSGSKPIAEKLNIPFVQEVAANAAALKSRYGTVGCAIELGGQDAKMIFFQTNPTTGALNVADMRMNGSCAGGTGAFIDEIASVLRIPVTKFNDMASKGTCVYDISGRCGVYAKTDIQPLLNQGVAKSDIALSAFHAIAKQTIGGLAQGLEIRKPVVFEGGPLTFNPTLVRVFAERLGLREDEILIPPHPELMVAMGAAVSLDAMFSEQSDAVLPSELMARMQDESFRDRETEKNDAKPFSLLRRKGRRLKSVMRNHLWTGKSRCRESRYTPTLELTPEVRLQSLCSWTIRRRSSGPSMRPMKENPSTLRGALSLRCGSSIKKQAQACIFSRPGQPDTGKCSLPGHSRQNTIL